MKTLSLKQPWAELVLQGKKTIEIRKWNTKFRGRFLIHASKNPDLNAMKFFGFDGLPLGFVVGKANLKEVKKYTPEEFKKDRYKHLATGEFGSYGFVLEEVKRIEPTPTKGQLGFWEFDSSKV